MSLVEWWGWGCALLGSMVAAPQIVRLVSARTSAGVSLLAWQLNTTAGLAWTVHGIIVGRANIIVPNVLIAVASAALVWLIVRDRGLTWPKVVAPILAFTVLLVGVELALGPVWFGFAVVVPGAGAMLAQLRDLLERADIRGVSFTALVLMLAVQLNWLGWSLAAHDSAITVAATIASTTALGTVIGWLVRRLGFGPWTLPARRATPESPVAS